MRKLALTILTLLTLPTSVLASVCSDGISKDRNNSRQGKANCANCDTVMDFAYHGAALLKDNERASWTDRTRPQYDELLVSGQGGRIANVSISSNLGGSGISFSLAHPRLPFGIGFELPDISTSHTAVSAIPEQGNFISSPWQNVKVANRVLTAKCRQIEHERHIFELNNPSSEINNALFSSEASAMNGNQAMPRSSAWDLSPFYTPWDFCTACYTEPWD